MCGYASALELPAGHLHGRVAAALATGNNCSRARPSRRRVWHWKPKLMHAAGIPVDALQLLHGAGETVGAALVAQPRVAGVVFTGSTQGW